MTENEYEKARIEVIEYINGQPKPGSWNEFVTHRNDQKRLFRVNIAATDAASLRELIDIIHNDPLVSERCLDTHAISGVYVYDTMLTLQLPIAIDWAASVHQKLTIFCLRNALITVHNAEQNNNLQPLTDSTTTINRPQQLPLNATLHFSAKVLALR